MTTWDVILMPEAIAHLADIKDRAVQQSLKTALQRLQEEPDKRGKALVGDLMGYRSIRAVGERYRIVYKAIQDKHQVQVITVAIRKEGSRIDAYNIAQHIVKKSRS